MFLTYRSGGLEDDSFLSFSSIWTGSLPVGSGGSEHDSFLSFDLNMFPTWLFSWLGTLFLPVIWSEHVSYLSFGWLGRRFLPVIWFEHVPYLSFVWLGILFLTCLLGQTGTGFLVSSAQSCLQRSASCTKITVFICIFDQFTYIIFIDDGWQLLADFSFYFQIIHWYYVFIFFCQQNAKEFQIQKTWIFWKRKM